MTQSVRTGDGAADRRRVQGQSRRRQQDGVSGRSGGRPDTPPEPNDGAPDAPGDPEAVARAICLRQLDRRARTRSELATALATRGVPDDAADRVLDRFTELGLIDDAALADAAALAHHRERGLAGRAVAVKLRRRGLDEQIVRAAVGQIDHDDEADAARRLVERKLRSSTMAGLEPTARARRLVGMLARRGYSPSLAHEVVRSAVADAAGELDGLRDADGID